MPAATEPRYWTPDDIWALPEDGHRYECIDGELLVSPSPTRVHQRVVGELYARLHGYLRGFPVGEVQLAPADIRLEPSSVVQPDLSVAPRGPAGKPLREWRDVAALILAIEVLSPSTARHDRITKRAFYQRTGVSEYWIVDIDARAVERWRPSDERPEIVVGDLRWAPDGAAEPLVINLPGLFREAFGEA